MTVYADTSVFVSLYVNDAHSLMADQMLGSGARLWITPLHVAEWVHAVTQHLFRQQMTIAEADRVIGVFEEDCATGVWEACAIPENAFDVCAELGRRHGSKLGVRTLDSLHVACALELKAQRFWSFDDRQQKLARAVNLRTG